MLICGDCGREMTCCKNEKAVYFTETARYPGDEFQCPECGTHVIECNDEHHLDPDSRAKSFPWVRGRSYNDPPWTDQEKLRTATERCPVGR